MKFRNQYGKEKLRFNLMLYIYIYDLCPVKRRWESGQNTHISKNHKQKEKIKTNAEKKKKKLLELQN